MKSNNSKTFIILCVAGYFPAASLLSATRTVHTIDFSRVTCEELQNFTIEFSYTIDRAALMHGFGCWFDIAFLGSKATVVLSTAPECPGTHWYQCRLLLTEPIGVNKGESILNLRIGIGTMKYYDVSCTLNFIIFNIFIYYIYVS